MGLLRYTVSTAVLTLHPFSLFVEYFEDFIEVNFGTYKLYAVTYDSGREFMGMVLPTPMSEVGPWADRKCREDS